MQNKPEILNWFKKPMNWWFGIVLVVNGIVLMRGVEGLQDSSLLGGLSILLGLILVVFYGRIKGSDQ